MSSSWQSPKDGESLSTAVKGAHVGGLVVMGLTTDHPTSASWRRWKFLR